MATPDLSDKPGQARLTLTKGRAWTRNIQLQTNAKPPVPIDLTGSQFKAVLRKADCCMQPIDLVASVVDAPTGKIRLTVPFDATMTLEAGAYAEDQRGAYEIVLEMVDSLGVTRTLLIIQVQLEA